MAITPNGLCALAVVHGDPTNSEIDHVVVVRVPDGGVERVIPLGGQPDSIAISADGRYAAISLGNAAADVKHAFTSGNNGRV